jgi:hypothetical protein
MTFRAQPLGQDEAAARLSDLVRLTMHCRHWQGDDRRQYEMFRAHLNLRESPKIGRLALSLRQTSVHQIVVRRAVDD